MEVTTITLLPQPGKDKQKCGSYKLLSLQTADYKMLSKIIAHDTFIQYTKTLFSGPKAQVFFLLMVFCWMPSYFLEGVGRDVQAHLDYFC